MPPAFPDRIPKILCGSSCQIAATTLAPRIRAAMREKRHVKVPPRVQVLLYEVGQDLGVRLGTEGMSPAYEALLKLQEILHNAVVYNGNLPVATRVWMCIR